MSAKYRFSRVYVELTKKCGLACSFCPSSSAQSSKVMPLAAFELICKKLHGYTNELCLHVLGDPLSVENLHDYLDIAQTHGFFINLTTTGHLLSKQRFDTLLHEAVRQVNFSLTAFSAGAVKLGEEQYLAPIVEFCETAHLARPELFVNLRLWNGAKNENIVERLQELFGVPIVVDRERTMIKGRILLNFDVCFEWPSLDADIVGSQGFCHALKSHIAVLNDGTVVPCCLDHTGAVALGNVFESDLAQIVDGERAKAMRNSFMQNRAVEELCKRCDYRRRFDAK